MSLYFKSALRIWFVALLLSLAVDALCYWLAQNKPAPLPGDGGIDYIAIFLVSAPAPFILAIAIVLLGGVLALLRGIWLGCRLLLRPAKTRPDRPAAPAMGLASAPQELIRREPSAPLFAGKARPL